MKSASAIVRILSALLMLSLFAVACADSGPAAPAALEQGQETEAAIEIPAQAPATVAQPAPVVEEEPIDERKALIEEIAAVLQDWQQTGGIPAASLSVRLPGEEPINIATGVTDIVSDDPVSVDDYFRIGSITKPMTAAVVLQLVDEGLIELDEPVHTYLPGWLAGYPYASELTIRQLMDHTNGLVEYALSPVFYAKAGERLETAMEPEEIFEWLAEQQPLFAPGEQYSYETGGFLTLGRVIEEVTGNSAAAEMRARIFEPAGAENIYLTPEEFPPEDTINAYGRDAMYLAGTVIIGRTDEAGLTINDEPVVDMSALPQEVLRSSGWTGGGNEARVESVSAIMRALFDGTILSEAQIAEMIAPTLDVTYGLGISNDEIDGVRVYSHGGGVPGFRSQGNYLPDYDISYAVSTNLIPLPDGSGVSDLRDDLLPLLLSAVG